MVRDKIIGLVRDEMGGGEDIDQSLIDQISRHIIPQGVDIPKPESIFELSGIPVFTKKSISTLIGKAKVGKTTATAWIVSQCIRQSLTVLWVDTEQGEYYGSRTQYWILSIAGMVKSEHLHYLDLKVFSPTDRYSMMEAAIKLYNPDLVIVDGIRDMVFDINDPSESTIRSGDMMRCADLYDCHILSVLHTNKGNDNARGHIGTEMINKSETVISVNKDEAGNVVCSPEYTRSEPFSDFAFTRDSYGMPQLIEGYMGYVEVAIGRRSIKASDYTIEQHREILDTVFSGNEEGMNYSMLQDAFVAGYELNGISIGVNKARSFIAHLVQQNMLEKYREGMGVVYRIKNG